MGVSIASHLPPPPNSPRPEDPRMSGQHHDPRHAGNASRSAAESETEQRYRMFVDRIETIASRWGDEKYNEGLWSASDWKAGWLKDVMKAVWYKQAPNDQVNALAYLDTDKDFPPDILDGRFVSLACVTTHVGKRSPVRYKPSLHRLHMFAQIRCATTARDLVRPNGGE